MQMHTYIGTHCLVSCFDRWIIYYTPELDVVVSSNIYVIDKQEHYTSVVQLRFATSFQY